MARTVSTKRKMVCARPLAAALLCALFGGVAEARERLPSETLSRPAEEKPTTRRWGVFAGGAVLFLSGYALDIGLTYGIGHSGPATSLVPLIGPLLQLRDDWSVIAPANTGNPQVDQMANQRIREVNQTVQTVAYVVLAVDFAMQLAGLTMAIVGAAHRVPVRPQAATVSLAAGGVSVRF